MFRVFFKTNASEPTGRWPFLRALSALALSVLWLATPPAAAQDQPARVQATMAAAAQSLKGVQSALARGPGDEELTALREQALAINGQASIAAEQLAPLAEAARARVDELGPAPEGVAESPELQRRRRALAAELERLDGLTKGARLIALEAEQAADTATEIRRRRFNAQILRRTESPLSPGFWAELFESAPADQRRALQVSARVEHGFQRLEPWRAGLIGAAALVLLLLLIPLNAWIVRSAQRRMIARAPAARLRRSGLAVVIVLAGVLIPLAGVFVLAQGLRWAGAADSAEAQRLMGAAAISIGVGAYVVALGRALLLPGRASWRLMPIPESTVQALRGYPAAAGVTIALGSGLEQVNRLAHTSLAANIAADAAVTLAYCGLASAFLAAVGRIRRRTLAESADAGAPARASVWSLLTVCVWAVVLTVLVSIAAGYIAFASAVARQAVWIGMVAGATYLLLKLTDDVFTSLLNGSTGFGRYAALSLGVKPSTADQLGVLLSGAARTLLVLVAAAAVAAPFGADLSGLFTRLSRVAGGFKVGEVEISPGAVLTALISFAVGVALVRAVRRWLDKKYLPTTELDVGVRHSLSAAVGYIGVVVVGFWALAILGIGLQRIALVASALSVGIGFGLQAIVQNFVSGLILLAERPVKVGDLVVVGGQEGDVRRISVRATEIQMPDRSTLLVPNSELITKTVLNRTMANPLGRIQIELDLDHDADPARVHDIMMAVFHAEPAVVEDPAPVVFLDSVRSSGLHFNAFAHVSSPRDAYPVRSRMLFEIIRRFRADGIELGRPLQEVRVASAPEPARNEPRAPAE